MKSGFKKANKKDEQQKISWDITERDATAFTGNTLEKFGTNITDMTKTITRDLAGTLDDDEEEDDDFRASNVSSMIDDEKAAAINSIQQGALQSAQEQERREHERHALDDMDDLSDTAEVNIEGAGDTNKNNNADDKQSIPEEYLESNPYYVTPHTVYLNEYNDVDKKIIKLNDLLEAADKDYQLHLARVHAALALRNETSVSKSIKNNSAGGSLAEQGSSAVAKRLLQNWNLKTDANRIERQTRSEARQESMELLRSQTSKIKEQLATTSTSLTRSTGKAEARIQHWKRAMDLYVYCPDSSGMDLLQLVDKLCEGCTEEEELLEALSQAVASTSALVESTSLAVKDALQDAMEEANHYQLRMSAHSIYAKQRYLDAHQMDKQFKSNGKTAMKIGQQLELAEAKLCQYEKTSVILRALWAMEALAFEEEESGVEIDVINEIRGNVPPSASKLDSLYTAPENSLEAGKALQALRFVLKSRGSTASSGMIDPSSIRRFEVTSKLILRVSDAVEARLLNSFAEIYARGGVYDFTNDGASGRNGIIDYIQLRDLTEALLYFDNGRNLFYKYINLVVVARFPELFDDDHWFAYEGGDGEEHELDMDETRSKLTTLFHRIMEVCMEEFELIAQVFDTPYNAKISTEESVQLQVARLLLQRIISHSRTGLQARINDLLSSVDRRSDIDSARMKLNTIVVIHEKAAGLFILLKEAAEKKLFVKNDPEQTVIYDEIGLASLVNFLNMEQNELTEGHRRDYLNLEMRLLHNDCCANLQNAGLKLLPPYHAYDTGGATKNPIRAESGNSNNVPEYIAPIIPINTRTIERGGFSFLLNGPLKHNVWRQPLTFGTDSLARARLMFGGYADPESTARVVLGIFNQMCSFYGQSYLFPIITMLGEMVAGNPPPSNPPNLPFNEEQPAHNLGVDGLFWVCVEQIQSAAKAFDRELWAENRANHFRTWELLKETGSHTSLTLARERRLRFYREIESRGEDTIMAALDAISKYMYWILVTGGESISGTGANWLLNNMQNQGTKGVNQGPYAMQGGGFLESQNSPGVSSLTFCLRAQFANVQAALTPQALSSFWNALSMRLHDILCARILEHYLISQIGAVILNQDVERLRSVAMLAGSNHSHWEILRELLTLYMTQPESLKAILVGPEGDIKSNKGLIAKAGLDRTLYFMSRRIDYRVKQQNIVRKSQWAVDLLMDLGAKDPSDGPVDPSLYAARRI